MGISLKKFINDYTPAGALYKAATGGKNLTDDAGEAWSKAVDDTGISATLGDAGQAVVNTAQTLYDAGPVKLITTGHNTITDAAGEAWANLTDAAGDTAQAVTNTVSNTVTNVKETVKETVQNVTKGVTGALPYLAIGGAAILGAALLFGRR